MITKYFEVKNCPFHLENTGTCMSATNIGIAGSDACSLAKFGDDYLPCRGLCGRCEILKVLQKEDEKFAELREQAAILAGRLDVVVDENNPCSKLCKDVSAELLNAVAIAAEEEKQK